MLARLCARAEISMGVRFCADSTKRPTDEILNQSVPRVSSSELRTCVKEEVGALGSMSRIVRTVSVDVKQH